MQDFETLKRSIESTKDLESVVRTMKTLAAVSIRQYEQAVDSLEDYSDTVYCGLEMVLSKSLPGSNLSDGPAAGTIGMILFGSDQGMCGQFNEQLETYAAEYFAETELNKRKQAWMIVGSRMLGKTLDSGHDVDFDFSLPGSATGIAPLVSEMLAKIDQWRHRQRLSEIYIFYNQRESASTYKPHVVQLLPVDPTKFHRKHQSTSTSRSLPLYTMSRTNLLSRLIQQYLFVSLFRACAESLAGENASRIASMQAAERNIKERLMNLQAEFNQRRQTAITEELLDVVTGFEALKDAE